MTQPSDQPPDLRLDVELRVKFPLGARTADGRFVVLLHVQGVPENGIYSAEAADGMSPHRYLATLSTQQTVPYPVLQRALALETPGIAPLLYVGPVETGEFPLAIDALVEQMPEGRRSHEWMGGRLGAGAATWLALATGKVVQEAHRRGLVLAGIRPEAVWAAGAPDRPRLAGLTPRAERFWQTARPLDFGVPPAFAEIYAAPEWLGGNEPGQASDVFSLCATLARWLGGAHPFAGGNYIEQTESVLLDRRRSWDGPPTLAALLDRGLARDPAQRAPLPEVLEGLLRFAHSIGVHPPP